MAATVVSVDVLGLHIGATGVCVRRAERIRHVPAFAARLGDGWVFGDAASALGPTDVLDPVRAVDSAELLTGLVRYAAAAVGASPDTELSSQCIRRSGVRGAATRCTPPRGVSHAMRSWFRLRSLHVPQSRWMRTRDV